LARRRELVTTKKFEFLHEVVKNNIENFSEGKKSRENPCIIEDLIMPMQLVAACIIIIYVQSVVPEGNYSMYIKQR
jgi:hypothetical protein